MEVAIKVSEQPRPVGSLTAEALRLLQIAEREFPQAVLASSMGLEDMVLTDLIARHALPIEIFTLDTGRLYEETYALMQTVQDHYGLSIAAYAPNAADLESYIADNGPNGFYNSVLARQACCHIRKVKPLQRALSNKGSWITGQRRAQSATRQNLPLQERDLDNGLEKFNPLADWSDAEVNAYIEAYKVPVNPLHARGFFSIGCAPCTRATGPGEDIRAGRWWWESPEHKECGLHIRRKSS